MKLDENFKIENLSALAKKDIDAFLVLLKKQFPNIEAVIIFDDPSYSNDRSDEQINLCIVSDDFTKSKGCAYHIPCRGGDCIVRSYESDLEKIVDKIGEAQGTFADMDIEPYPMSIEMYLTGDTYYDSWIYQRGCLYFGDKKYDPKTVYEQLPSTIEERKTFDTVKEVLYKRDPSDFIKNGGSKEKYDEAAEKLFRWSIGIWGLCAEFLVERIEKIFMLPPSRKHEAVEIAKEITEKRHGNKYEGETENYRPHGKGKFFFADGRIYDGNFKKGNVDGNGTVYYPDGDRLEGEFDDTETYQMYGKGILYRADGTRYEGGFNYGDKYGFGVEYDKDGNILYEGDFEHGMRRPQKIFEFENCILCGVNKVSQDGFYCTACNKKLEEFPLLKSPRHSYRLAVGYEKGKIGQEQKIDQAIYYYKEAIKLGLTDAEKALKRLAEPRYEGEVNAESKAHGKGIKIYESGARFDGEWRDGKAVKGTVFWANGDKYEGEFENGTYNGKGVLDYTHSYNCRARYEGEFKDGKYNGKGVWTYNGFRYEGEFKDGKHDGYGVYFYSNGNRYEGEWKDGEKHGKGSFIYASGTCFDGFFVYGKNSFNGMDGAYFFRNESEKPEDGTKLNGNGVFFWGSGQRYEGEFKDVKFDGFGTMFAWHGYKMYEGGFKNGSRHGKGTELYRDGTSCETEYNDGSKIEQ